MSEQVGHIGWSPDFKAENEDMKMSTSDLRNIVMKLEKSGSEEDRQNALAMRMFYSLGCFESAVLAEPQEGKE